jgi:hypothetical protein
VSLASELDNLPTPPKSPREKLLETLALYDEGLELQRLVLLRRFPGIDPEQLENRLQAWLRREGPDEAG